MVGYNYPDFGACTHIWNFTQYGTPIGKFLAQTLGYHILGSLDNLLLVGNTVEECRDSVNLTLELFDSLGLTIHPDKSVVEPTTIEFLGFILDSENMEVRPTEKKKTNISNQCAEMLKRNEVTILEMAQLLEILIALDPGVHGGMLYTKRMEMDKNTALKMAKGKWGPKKK